MRGLIACLATCHEDVRIATEPFFEGALETLKEAHNDFFTIKGEEPKHVSAIKRRDGQKEEDHYVDYSKQSRLKDLRQVWKGLKWVQRGYVSSEIISNKDTYPTEHQTIWIAK